MAYTLCSFYRAVLAHKLNALLTATAALAAFSTESLFFFFLALTQVTQLSPFIDLFL